MIPNEYEDMSGDYMQTYESLLPFGIQNMPATAAYQTRVRRGIVNECCLKSCTWDTLRSYCG